jgi:chromosomal replication initiation ATPase DnaA
MIDLSTIPTPVLLDELKTRQAVLRSELAALDEAMQVRPVPCKEQADRLAAAAGPVWGVVPARIFHTTRQGNIAEARQAVMYVLRSRYHYTYQEIGEAMQRDHGTIIHGYRAMIDRLPAEPDLANRVAMLLESSH